MPAAPHVARLRDEVGHDLLLLPSVAVWLFDHDLRWFARDELDHPDIGDSARNTFIALGWL